MIVEESLAGEPRALVLSESEALDALHVIAALEGGTVHYLVQGGSEVPLGYAVGWNGLAWGLYTRRWIWDCPHGVFAYRTIASLGHNIYPAGVVKR